MLYLYLLLASQSNNNKTSCLFFSFLLLVPPPPPRSSACLVAAYCVLLLRRARARAAARRRPMLRGPWAAPVSWCVHDQRGGGGGSRLSLARAAKQGTGLVKVLAERDKSGVVVTVWYFILFLLPRSPFALSLLSQQWSGARSQPQFSLARVAAISL